MKKEQPNPMEEILKKIANSFSMCKPVYSVKDAYKDLDKFINDNYISKEEVEKLEIYQVSTIPELLGKELIDKNKLT